MKASWQSIADIAASGEASTTFKIGDTKAIKLNGKTYHAQIIGFDHDNLATTDAKYSTTSYNRNKKKAAITFQLVELFDTSYNMNSSATNTGRWNSSMMRTQIMPLIRNYMSTELQNNLRTVVKKTASENNSATMTNTNDYLFLPAIIEICPINANATQNIEYSNEGTAYQYWITNDNNSTRSKHTLEDFSGFWWTRSPNVTNNSGFFYITDEGYPAVAYGSANSRYHIAPCFCL